MKLRHILSVHCANAKLAYIFDGSLRAGKILERGRDFGAIKQNRIEWGGQQPGNGWSRSYIV